MSVLHGFFMRERSSSLSPGKELHRMCLCPESSGDHSADGGPAQPAPAGHCQNLPERERLRCVWEVRSNLQHAYPIPDIPLHRHPHHSVRPAVSDHSDAQVRTRIFLCPLSPVPVSEEGGARHPNSFKLMCPSEVNRTGLTWMGWNLPVFRMWSMIIHCRERDVASNFQVL